MRAGARSFLTDLAPNDGRTQRDVEKVRLWRVVIIMSAAAAATTSYQQSRVAEKAAIFIYETLLQYEKLRGGPQLDDARYFWRSKKRAQARPPRRAEPLLTLGGQITAPPPPVTPLPPKPVANAKTARACLTSLDCPGAQTCEENQCADELAK